MFNLEEFVFLELRHLNDNNYGWIAETWVVLEFHPVTDIHINIAKC